MKIANVCWSLLARLSLFASKPLPVTDEWGNKDVLGLIDGFRESTQSWRDCSCT